MKQNYKKYMIFAASAVMSVSMSMAAFAVTKYVDIEVNTDNVPEHNAV